MARIATDAEWEAHKENPNKLIRTAGSKRSFQCHCECNVFHHETRNFDQYTCNACGSLFEAVREEGAGGVK